MNPKINELVIYAQKFLDFAKQASASVNTDTKEKPQKLTK